MLQFTENNYNLPRFLLNAKNILIIKIDEIGEGGGVGVSKVSYLIVIYIYTYSY